MTQEKTNTNERQLLPEGSYTFTVKGRPEKKKTEKSSYRIWKFTYIDDKEGTSKQFSTIMFPWKSKELLLALGGKDLGEGIIEWDDDKVDGRQVHCSVVHQQDNKGVMRETLQDCISVDGTAWDE